MDLYDQVWACVKKEITFLESISVNKMFCNLGDKPVVSKATELFASWWWWWWWCWWKTIFSHFCVYFLTISLKASCCPHFNLILRSVWWSDLNRCSNSAISAWHPKMSESKPNLRSKPKVDYTLNYPGGKRHVEVKPSKFSSARKTLMTPAITFERECQTEKRITRSSSLLKNTSNRSVCKRLNFADPSSKTPKKIITPTTAETANKKNSNETDAIINSSTTTSRRRSDRNTTDKLSSSVLTPVRRGRSDKSKSQSQLIITGNASNVTESVGNGLRRSTRQNTPKKKCKQFFFKSVDQSDWTI